MLILNFFLLKGGMLFCYDVAMYQSKDGKPLNRLMASRGRSFKQTSLALVHEVGAVLCAIHFICSLYRHGIAFVHKGCPLSQLTQVAIHDFQNNRPNRILSPVCFFFFGKSQLKLPYHPMEEPLRILFAYLFQQCLIPLFRSNCNVFKAKGLPIFFS